MALNLDSGQIKLVDSRRLPPGERPQYYSAATRSQVEISEDFEAFLILQGRQRNGDTTKWLEQCVDFETRDQDRDALAATMLKNEIEDAVNAQRELAPLQRLYQRFRESYKLTGFENVVEAGKLLDDVRHAMLEIQNLIARNKHREIFGKLALDALRVGGNTTEDQKQLNSWFSPLSTY